LTDRDFQAFGNLVRRLGVVYRTRDVDQMIASYFQALRANDLAALESGADAWMITGKFFPKPVEWRGAIPPASGPSAGQPPLMTPTQMRDSARAIALHWEDAPCGCPSCVEAKVHEKPLRYVPLVDADGTERRATHPGTRASVVLGRWAHGWELFRWYDARATFYDEMVRQGFRGDGSTPRTKRVTKLAQRGA
jgi:hypothetical protein